MKYMNTEIASAIVTSIVMTAVMYYLNRNNKEPIPLKTYVKTFAINCLVVVGMLYLKKNVLDKYSSGGVDATTGGSNSIPEFNDISVGTPNF